MIRRFLHTSHRGIMISIVIRQMQHLHWISSASCMIHNLPTRLGCKFRKKKKIASLVPTYSSNRAKSKKNGKKNRYTWKRTQLMDAKVDVQQHGSCLKFHVASPSSIASHFGNVLFNTLERHGRGGKRVYWT